MESDQMESRVRLFLSACMISCVSVRRKDSQGCTADVKDTPPSPKEKPDDLIGPDIDPVGDHDDLMATGSRLSIESFDSGVSFKSNWSKDGLIDFKEGVSPSRLDLSSFEKKHDVSDDGFFESPDDQMAMGRTLSVPAKSGFHIPLRQQSPFMMAHRSVEAFGSSLTLMNDSFIRPRQDSLPRMVLRSMEAFGSGLSLKSDSFIRTGQHSPPSSEQQQRPHSAWLSVNMGANSSRMAEEIAWLRMERRAERRAQRDKERMAEEIAQLRKERYVWVCVCYVFTICIR
ncbi:uncharacterized protein LOC125901202 isoform X2 [Epinephelus fuscoguttatus]|uniref:uncharacterized protein LOC125901202 isoform X2 n=1 Tax=Epinephelus fuscoguttatus TaxID=293821 RepID=UPI0020D0EB40|nr:uncharacterized protein LOC125901202 isoform X2 [Epinephelus fuscoguttatus]